ncbi:MAG: hypothetical protein Q4F33_01545, partial [Mycoplasmatota bacterium]|nr:hypothetical protein [Mycoplasmatota bacterium]
KEKKHLSLMDKDFDAEAVSFTDSFLMGCYYSVNSPMYFSKLVSKNEFIDDDLSLDAYAMGDYELCLKNLYKVCAKLKLNDIEKYIFLDAFKSEWKLLEKNSSTISLMLITRSSLGVDFDIDKFITEVKDNSFIEAVCKLLGQRSNVLVSKYIRKDDITLLNLSSSKKYTKEEKKDSLAVELERTFIRSDEFAFSNTYGKVSILLLVGTMCITIGVILTMLSFS